MLRRFNESETSEQLDALLGERVSAADAYAFTIVGWAGPTHIDLAPFPHLRNYVERIGTRPMVKEAMRAEGLLPAAA